VCFRWHEQGTTPEAYLRAVDRVFERVAREGAAPIAWTTNSYSFALPPVAFPTMLRVALDLLRERATHGVGFAQRELFADGAGRRMGPALAVAESLASSTRSGELLVDSSIEAVERGELTAVGSLRFDVAGLSVSAALMVATSASASGFAPSVRRNPSITPTETESHSDELMLHFDDGAWDTVTPPRGTLYPTEPATLPGAVNTSGGVLHDLYENDDELFSLADEPTNPGISVQSEQQPATSQAVDGEQAPPSESGPSLKAVVVSDATASPDTSTVPRLKVPRPDLPSPPPRRQSPSVGPVASTVPAPPPLARSSSRLSAPPPKPSQRRSIAPSELVAPLDDEASDGAIALPPIRRLSPPPPKPAGQSSNPSRSRLSTPPPKPSRAATDRISAAPDAPERKGQVPRVSHITALAGDDAKSMMRMADRLWHEEKDEELVDALRQLVKPTNQDLESALSQLQVASEGHPIEDASGRARVALAHALCLAQAGKPADALLESLQALTSARRAGDDAGTKTCEMLLAELARYTGQPQLAERWLRIPKLFAQSGG